ncbi:uncharacterized protein ARMOST_17727 [Armillaria ostoyae]|uniref:RING-type domain-containing protein n=1 Tax=Armillaria ostoyae TaxID=47428 RepID=A0A284RZU1_ARMOS|nr:uncharacterized protein ARMOST_17727 [Armillaria ostoyae]
MSSSPRQHPAATTEPATDNDGIAPVGLAFRALIQVRVDLSSAVQCHNGLYQENQDLVHCLDELERAFNDLRHRGEIAERAHQRLDSVLQVELQCPRCHHIMWMPYQIQCGHSVCFACCTAWFQEQDMAFERQHPGYNSRAPVPLPSLYYHLAAVGHAELWEIAVLFFLLLHPPMTRPRYTCPCCAKELTIPPFENRRLRSLIHAWAQLRGHPTPPTLLRDDQGPPVSDGDMSVDSDSDHCGVASWVRRESSDTRDATGWCEN